MIQEGDPQELPGVVQPLRQDPIFLTRRHLAGGMVMLCGVGNYVEFLQTDAAVPA